MDEHIHRDIDTKLIRLIYYTSCLIFHTLLNVNFLFIEYK